LVKRIPPFFRRYKLCTKNRIDYTKIIQIESKNLIFYIKKNIPKSLNIKTEILI